MPRVNPKFAWVALTLLVVGVLAVYAGVLGKIALEKYTNYTTIDRALRNSYAYRVEYRPYWLRESGKNGTQVFYTNEITLKIVKGWDGQDRLNVDIANAAQQNLGRARGKAFYVDTMVQRLDAPVIFNRDDYGSDFFIRVTSTYDGGIIVDTMPRPDSKWVSLVIDASYLDR